MNSSLWKVVAAVVLLLAVVMVTERCYSAKVDEWERRVQVVMDEADNLRSRAEVAEAEAEQLRSQAVTVAEGAGAREIIIEERIVELPPPVTARDTAADEIIEELKENRDEYKLAYELESAAHDKTREALFLEQVRGDSLYIALEERPTKKPWWIPELVVGPQAGISWPTGKPTVGFGVTLGWKIKI
jgi:hypothetical protein